MRLSSEMLVQNFEALEKQIFWLNVSLTECHIIGLKEDYSIDEFGRLETLTSRFSRSIDFLVRKMFRSIDDYEFESQGTLIDVVNNADKRGLITSVEEIRIIKDIRNEIVHEYVEEGLLDTFEDVLKHGDRLLEMMQKTAHYCAKVK